MRGNDCQQRRVISNCPVVWWRALFLAVWIGAIPLVAIWTRASGATTAGASGQPPPGPVDFPPPGPVDRPPPGPVDSPPPGPVERPPPGPVDLPPPGPVESPPPGPVERPPLGPVDRPPPGPVEHGPPGPVEPTHCAKVLADINVSARATVGRIRKLCIKAPNGSCRAPDYGTLLRPPKGLSAFQRRAYSVIAPPLKSLERLIRPLVRRVTMSASGRLQPARPKHKLANGLI